MGLPRPPLAHPVLLSLPPHLPPLLVDQMHSLLFERLLVPQLLVGSRPFFAAAGAGVLSGVVLDLGARGEGSEISVVHESQVVEDATMRVGVDEGDCDDWLSFCLLEENPGLHAELRKAEDGPELSPTELAAALNTVVQNLKALEGAIGFQSALLGGAGGVGAGVAKGAADESGEFDVAKALVDGSVDKVLNKKAKPTNHKTSEEEGDTVEVPHPLNPSAAPLKIGKARHRWLEPLFVPELLAKLRPSQGPTAALLGLERYEGRETQWTGLHEALGVVVGRVGDAEMRRAVWEAVVVISTGKVANNKGASFSWLCMRLGLQPGADVFHVSRSARSHAPPPPNPLHDRPLVRIRHPAPHPPLHQDARVLQRVQGPRGGAMRVPGRVHSRQAARVGRAEQAVREQAGVCTEGAGEL